MNSFNEFFNRILTERFARPEAISRGVVVEGGGGRIRIVLLNNRLKVQKKVAIDKPSRKINDQKIVISLKRNPNT